MLDKIGPIGLVAIILGGMGAGIVFFGKDLLVKEEHLKVDDCIKMSFPEVEEWNGGMTAKVKTVGKKSYEVRYWAEYGWTNLTDTWPFSQPVAKVACPVEVKD